MAFIPFAPTSLRHILATLVTELVGHMPGVRDGDVESIHAARVATRRLREVLPLVSTGHPEQMDVIRAAIRRAGRRLGRVRELDVMRDHLDRLERRFPAAATAVAVARRTVSERQMRARRRLIKSLERLRLDRFNNGGAPPSGGGFALLRNRARAFGDWNGALRDRIGARARDVADEVERGSGVYFPRRAHATRIAAKKLRYSVELAQQTGLWRPSRLLRDLKRLQSTLGDLHDTQVLIDRLDDLAPADSVPERDRTILVGALRADIDRLHGDYLAKRDRLRAISGACARFARDTGQTWHLPRPLVAASALAVPVGVLLLAGSRAAATVQPSGRGVPPRLQARRNSLPV